MGRHYHHRRWKFAGCRHMRDEFRARLVQSSATTTTQVIAPPAYQLEYEEANEWWRHTGKMRRLDVAIVTAIQAVALFVIGAKLLDMNLSQAAFSLIACAAALIGLTHERSLNYMLRAAWERSREIEAEQGLWLITRGQRELQRAPLFIRTHVVLMAYYLMLAAGWCVIWVAHYEPRLYDFLVVAG